MIKETVKFIDKMRAGKHEPASLDPERYRDMYAGFICENYGLDINKCKVLERLK